MNEILKIVSVALYSIIGVISLIMAYKSFFTRKFLPFHEEAYGKPWDEVEKNLQFVITTLMKVSGLGFLTIAFLLIVFPIYNYFNSNLFLKYAIPFIALIYCFGLFLFNFNLFNKTKAKTPWKNSLFAMVIIILNTVISSL